MSVRREREGRGEEGGREGERERERERVFMRYFFPLDSYAVMQKCWQLDATERPDFTELISMLNTLQDNSLRQHIFVRCTHINCSVEIIFVDKYDHILYIRHVNNIVKNWISWSRFCGFLALMPTVHRALNNHKETFH